MENKKPGKPKMTPQVLKARQDFLANETIEARTKRVLNPRLNRVFKQLDDLISVSNSPRYRFTQEQTKKIFEEIEKRTIALKQVFDKTENKEIKNIL